MLRNYLKTSFRNLLKNPLSSFINVFGLAMAIGTAMMVYAYISYEHNVDQHHLKKDHIFMVTTEVNFDGEEVSFGTTPAPVGLHLRRDFPQIINMARVADRNVVISRGENVFHEWIRLVDPGFLQMFTFPLKYGQTNALEDPGQIVINHEMAVKYFGDANPVGEIMTIRFPGGSKRNFTVGGVAEQFPQASLFRFNFLINIEVLEALEEDLRLTDWAGNVAATFIELSPDSDITSITGRMSDYVKVVNQAQADYPVIGFNFELFATLYNRSRDIRNDISNQADLEGQIILTVIGLFILTLSCLNYVNIAIASATRRLKEIGVRKVIGASKALLVVQFIGENILLTFFALIVGFILAVTLFIPGFDNLFGIGLDFTIWDVDLWLFLGGLLLVTAIASGAYPAIYISRFEAVTIFRGKVLFGRKNLLTRIFLSFQFILACITVVSGIAFTLNSRYQQERDWGYDQANALVTAIPDYSAFEILKNEMSRTPEVVGISGGVDHLGKSIGRTVIQLPDRKYEARQMDVAANYIETMGLHLIEGRDFMEEAASDRQSVVINETMASRLNWDDPIGQIFRLDELPYTVIGVVRDFHYYSFWTELEPVFLRVAEESAFQYMVIRTLEGKSNAVLEDMKATWSSLFPELPFEGVYQEQFFEYYFNNIRGHGIMMSFVALLALLLACFGLFGLVSLNVASRTREFSIRKVLGADLWGITQAVNSHFFYFMIIALILGAPISFYLVKWLFSAIYVSHMPLTTQPVFVAIGLILLTILLTVTSQINKVQRTNPTVGLRNE